MPSIAWRRAISHVATEEMLHLALVHNLLSAIGAAPHLGRPNLPAPAHHYPAGVNLTLVRFGEPALRHFMFLGRPEGMALEGAEGIDAPVHEAVPLMAERDSIDRAGPRAPCREIR
jgi:Ferritin-like